MCCNALPTCDMYSIQSCQSYDGVQGAINGLLVLPATEAMQSGMLQLLLVAAVLYLAVCALFYLLFAKL